MPVAYTSQQNRNFDSETLRLTWLPDPFIESKSRFSGACAKQETITILRALESCPGREKLRHFSHDKLPHSFFVIEKPVLEKLSTSFRNLTTFRIQMEVDCGLEKWRRAWTRLGQLLAVMEHLEDLRFGIDGVQSPKLDYSHWELDQEHLDLWYIPLWKVLGDTRWKSLKALHIEGLLLCEEGLSDVIGRHAATLRSLDLKDIGLWEGNFRDLLKQLKPVLKLDQFRVWGSIQSIHSRNKEECWRFRPRIEPENECWSEAFKKSYIKYEDKMTDFNRDGGITSEEAWNRLVGYMKSPISAPWPLVATDIVRDMLLDAELYHSATCTGCRSTKGIAQQWDDFAQQETPELQQMVEWTAQEIQYDRVLSEEQIKPFYGADGFDSHGNDKNGFDRYGAHMETQYKNGYTYFYSIADMVIRREMLKQIPRYVEAGVAPTFCFPLEKRNYCLFLSYCDV